jgi:hypothetical protein
LKENATGMPVSVHQPFSPGATLVVVHASATSMENNNEIAVTGSFRAVISRCGSCGSCWMFTGREDLTEKEYTEGSVQFRHLG